MKPSALLTAALLLAIPSGLFVLSLRHPLQPTVAPSEAPPVEGLVKGIPASRFFLQYCAACHGAERQGGTGLPLKPDRLTQPDDFYAAVIHNGRPGTAMPAWSFLDEESIKALVHELKHPTTAIAPPGSVKALTPGADLSDAPSTLLVAEAAIHGPALSPGEAVPVRWSLKNPGREAVRVVSIQSDALFALDALPLLIPAGGAADLHFSFAPPTKDLPASADTVEGSAAVRLERADGAGEWVRLRVDARRSTPSSLVSPMAPIALRDMPARLASRGPYLYVAYLRGSIDVFRMDGARAERVESIETIARTPNHNRQGQPDPKVPGRFIGGIAVDSDGTLYVTHCDPRMIDGGRADGAEADLNSGTITALHGQPGSYDLPAARQELVVGLPRNQMNHFPLGTALGPDGWLYVAVGAMTDSGMVDDAKPNPDTALSGAVLRLNLKNTGASFPLRLTGPGLTFADAGVLVPGLLEVWATGLRNGFGLTFDQEGFGYLTDQSSDGGGAPAPAAAGGPPGVGPVFTPDHLHRFKAGDYLGQPNLSREERVLNDGSAYATPVQSPGYVPPIHIFGRGSSSCGLAFYRGDRFPELQGRLLVAKYGGIPDGSGGVQALTLEQGHVTAVQTLWAGAMVTDVVALESGQIVLSDLYESRLIILDKAPTAQDKRPLEARSALQDGNEVYNGGFQPDVHNELPHWDLVLAAGGKGRLSPDKQGGKNLARLELLTPPRRDIPYAVQLCQTDIPLLYGHRYRLSVRARAATARPLLITLGGMESRDWRVYSSQTVDLTASLQQYTLNFQMNESTDPRSRLSFNVGQAAAPVWIGDARLEDLTP